MIVPALNKLMEKVDCRYTLVAVIAQRARQIVDDEEVSNTPMLKPIASAVEDLMNDRISYTRDVGIAER